MTTQHTLTDYEAGKAAAHAGKHVATNPYRTSRTGRDNYREWQNGWRDGDKALKDAAPDLLAALKLADGELAKAEYHPECAQRRVIRAAIAKAEGR